MVGDSDVVADIVIDVVVGVTCYIGMTVYAGVGVSVVTYGVGSVILP